MMGAAPSVFTATTLPGAPMVLGNMQTQVDKANQTAAAAKTAALQAQWVVATMKKAPKGP